MGKDYDRENAWADEIAQKSWAQAARKDVPYNLKILDNQGVNAFSTVGGYVHLSEGVLDFARSDDELAGIIGHETGYIERRHAVELNDRTTLLNVRFGVASIFSPIVYHAGLLLMSRARGTIPMPW